MEYTTAKFWVIQYLEDFLRQHGFGRSFTDLITFIIACAALSLVIWGISILVTKVAIIYIKRATKRSKTLWDDYLFSRKFFHRILYILPAFAVLYFVKIFFEGYDVAFINAANTIIQCFIVFMIILSISAFLDAANDVYDERSKQKSIKGYVQTAKIFVFVLGIIVIISIILNESLSNLFLGLGASAAIVTLVFKDTILGFVASIQLSGQDMIRRGDWITVQASNADGIVKEISLSTVKVQNWDNTITMVPIYSLVTGSFTNWRSMMQSTGRRFTRNIFVDILSVRIVSKDEINKIRENELIADREAMMMVQLSKSNSSKFTTNIGLYRSYIEAYLRMNPNINRTLGLGVRYLQQDDSGMRLEIYAFSIVKDTKGYERIISDINEHIVAVAPVFGINIFQRPCAHPRDNAPTTPQLQDL